MYWYMLIGFLFGVALSVLVMAVRSDNRKKNDKTTEGTLALYVTDEDGPYLNLELDKPVDTIFNRKHVSFRVDVRRIDSQK